jgi:hypothetical protein
MSIRKRLAAAVLAIAIASPIADFFWSKSMPQATTSMFQWASARATVASPNGSCHLARHHKKAIGF